MACYKENCTDIKVLMVLLFDYIRVYIYLQVALLGTSWNNKLELLFLRIKATRFLSLRTLRVNIGLGTKWRKLLEVKKT